MDPRKVSPVYFSHQTHWITVSYLGSRWQFIVAGAVVTLILDAVWLALPLYSHLRAHFAYFYLLSIGVRGQFIIIQWILIYRQNTAGPLILNWISEITQADVREISDFS